MADHRLQVRGDRSREGDHCQDSHEGSWGHIPSSSTKKRGMYILYYIIGTVAWVSVESSAATSTISHSGKNVISIESEAWTDTNQIRTSLFIKTESGPWKYSRAIVSMRDRITDIRGE